MTDDLVWRAHRRNVLHILQGGIQISRDIVSTDLSVLTVCYYYPLCISAISLLEYRHFLWCLSGAHSPKLLLEEMLLEYPTVSRIPSKFTQQINLKRITLDCSLSQEERQLLCAWLPLEQTGERTWAKLMGPFGVNTTQHSYCYLLYGKC